MHIASIEGYHAPTEETNDGPRRKYQNPMHVGDVARLHLGVRLHATASHVAFLVTVHYHLARSAVVAMRLRARQTKRFAFRAR
jgi:hypothetical protein